MLRRQSPIFPEFAIKTGLPVVRALKVRESVAAVK